MKKLLIVGAGGQGKVVLDCAVAMGNYSDISFMTNDVSIRQIAGYPIYYEQAIMKSSPCKEDAVYVADDTRWNIVWL